MIKIQGYVHSLCNMNYVVMYITPPPKTFSLWFYGLDTGWLQTFLPRKYFFPNEIFLKFFELNIIVKMTILKKLEK